MKYKIALLLSMTILLILTTSCSLLGGPSIGKAYDLLDDEQYSKAIDMFEALIHEDEEQYEAWFGIIEAYIEDDEYDEAEDTLEALLEIVLDHYDLEDEDIDYQDIVAEFIDYVEQIIEEEGEIGDWYLDFQPQTIDLYHLDFGTFTIGDELTFEVPSEGTVYYTLDGRGVNRKSEVYRGYLDIQNPGEYTLTVAVINDIGIKGPESYAIFNIVEGGSVLTANYKEGTYEGPITLFFDGYNPENQEVYLVIDGSNPEEGMYYEYGEGYMLYAGDYQIRAVIFNWETNEYSQALEIDITVTETTSDSNGNHEAVIKAPVTLEMVVYSIYDTIASEVQWVTEEVAYDLDNISINITTVSDYDALFDLYQSNNPPDLLYTWAPSVIDLYSYMGDVRSIVEINEGDFYPEVLDSVWYWDGYYTLPVTVRPYDIMFYNQNSASVYYDNGIDYASMIYEMELDPISWGITFPNSTDYWELMAYYDGFGGTIYNDMGYVTLEYQPLVNALSELKAMATNKYLSPYVTFEAWDDALYYGSSDFIVADPAEMGDVYMSSNYYPVGQVPISNGRYAAYPLSVDGLMISYEITQNPTSDKAIAIGMVYDYLSNQSEYNSFIANVSGAIPAKLGVYNQGEYFTSFLDNGYYEALIMASPALSIDLFELASYYMEFNSIVLAVMEGQMTPEEGATQIINDMAEVYLE